MSASAVLFDMRRAINPLEPNAGESENGIVKVKLRVRGIGRILVLTTVLTAATLADVTVVEDRLSTDMLVWANFVWRRTEVQGVSASRSDFYRRAGLLGITGHVSNITSVRLYVNLGDPWGQSAHDLYVDFRWPSGLLLRAGQFTPPLSLEATRRFEEWELVEYSLIARHWKPGDPRDVGVMVGYAWRVLRAEAAVVNGNGRNQGFDSDNKWKDLCGRLILDWPGESGLTFAVRGYLGKPDELGTAFTNLGGEVVYDRGSLQVAAEGQHAAFGYDAWNSVNIQASYSLRRWLEPVARFQMEFQSQDRYDFGATAGVNFPIHGDRLKVMLDFNYWHRESRIAANVVTERKIYLQVQAAL